MISDDAITMIANRPLKREDGRYVPAESVEDADVQKGELYTVEVDQP